MGYGATQKAFNTLDVIEKTFGNGVVSNQIKMLSGEIGFF